MRAVKILPTKETEGDEIVEIKIWQVPGNRMISLTALNTQLFISKAAKDLWVMSNAEGKGDQGHYGDREEPYKFTKYMGFNKRL